MEAEGNVDERYEV